MDSFKETDANASKKKIAVPLVVLMLCAVAVVGAGYAYTASLTVNDNTLTGGKISVDVDGEISDFLADTNADVIFTQDKIYDKDGGTSLAVVKAYGAGDSVTATLGSGKSASLLGTASVTITNHSGKSVSAVTVTASLADSLVVIGTKTIGDILASFLLKNGSEYTELSNGGEVTIDLASPLASGSSTTVSFDLYAVVIDGVEVANGADADVNAMIAALAGVKLNFVFSVETAA